jgi:hypothetical protein
VAAPEEVVRRLLGSRLLECVAAHALRVGATEDVLDGRVLARGVDALQDDQDGARFLGVEPRLQVGDPAHQRRELL